MDLFFKTSYKMTFVKYLKYLIVGFITVFAFAQAKATHIVGGEMTYRCLGNNRYEIIITVYRDCFYGDPDAYFDDPAWIAFYKGRDNTPANVGIDGVVNVPYNPLDTLDGQITSECKVLGQDVCVHRAVYRTVVTLPVIQGGYNITYQRCCRNQTLENIVDPLNTGAIFTVFISEKALRECNSSPMIVDWPPIYICANKPLNYNHSAVDADGDTLLYRLCTPLQDGSSTDGRIYPPPRPPYDTVVWKDPFSLTNIFGGTDPLRIDYQTGYLYGTPPTVGQYLVGVCVDEFRDGVLLSRIRRDFQYNVRECINETTACFSLPDTICNTTAIKFNNCSEGAEEYYWEFENGTPATSTEAEPLVTFPDFGTYNVRLIARLDEKCIDTLDREIVLSTATIQSNFSMTPTDCGSEVVIKTTNLSVGGSNYRWYLNGANDNQTSSQFEPEFTVPSGIYDVTLVAYHMNGCSDTIKKQITVRTLDSIIQVKDHETCSDSSFALNPDGDATLVYTWTPATYLNDANIPNPVVVNPREDITYYVDILDPVSGCTYRDTVAVRVTPIPALAFDWTNDCGVLLVEFQNSSQGATGFTWDFGDGNTSNESNPVHTYETPGTYTVTLRNASGCIRSTSQEVSVDYIDINSINDSIFLCNEDMVNLNPDPNTNYEYSWSPAELLDDPTSPNPKATVTERTLFTVRVSHNVFRECYVEGHVLVDFAKVDASANGGNLICDEADIDLTLNILNGPPNPVITWTPDYNINSGQGTAVLNVHADTDTTYHVRVEFSNGCIIEQDVPVNVSTIDDIYITTDRDTIFDTEKIQLNVYPKGLRYQWSPPDGLDDPTSDHPIFTPPSRGDREYTFTVSVINADNCSLTEDVTLTVRETRCNGKYIFLPNAFSPNGRGDVRNEVLRLNHNGVVDKLNSLIIYNRFGQPVFSTTDLNFTWNGTFEGKELDPDVYGFYLDVECVGGEQFKEKGNITIVK